MTTFAITQEEPRRWVVSRYEKKPFRFGRWKVIQSCTSEQDAVNLVKKLAAFKPHTSYYDEHGTLLIEPTDW